VFYVDSRAIQKRLDNVLGPLNWKNQYVAWHGNAQLCGIAVYNPERNEWVGKFDGSECSDIEPIKGGLSDSMKRAACMWGIGRYLYDIPGVWVEVEQRGKGSYIKDSQQSKLKAAYEKSVATIFGASSNQNASSAALNKQSPSAPASQDKRTRKPPATPQQEIAPPPPEPVPDGYLVKSIKPSGKSSQLLELVDNAGEIHSAYVANNNAIIAGSRLVDVEMEKKQSGFMAYTRINSYQLAA